MSTLFDNAINSIKLGIEDFQSNDERRPVSALRNFYAGVLLLGKECLVRAAPEADPMEIIASKFVPVPNEDGGVDHEPKGYRTIDLDELRQRFKQFNLAWPSGDIKSLQKLRNELEHFHSSAPTETIRQAIAGCFPLVEGFFKFLGESPAETLESAWEVMLAEEAFFKKQKSDCDQSYSKLPWGESLSNTDMLSCSDCGSSLIFQTDPENDDPSAIAGKCLACGSEYEAEQTVRMIVEAEHGVDDYILVKDGGEPTIHDCPECHQPTYVWDGETNVCYYCDEAVSGECSFCGDSLSVTNQSVDNGALCDYCAYRMDKIRRE